MSKDETTYDSLSEIERKIIDNVNLAMDCRLDTSWEETLIVHKEEECKI